MSEQGMVKVGVPVCPLCQERFPTDEARDEHLCPEVYDVE